MATKSAMKGVAILYLLMVWTAIVQALPAELFKRLVGTLKCDTVKNGTLTLSSESSSYHVLIDSHNTLYSNVTGSDPILISLPQFTDAYTQSLANFVFVACKARDATNPFMEWPQEQNGIYYGHLSPVYSGEGVSSNSGMDGNPPLCATSVPANDQLTIVAGQRCDYSDDSGQFLSYFKYSPADDGKLEFLGFTAPGGALPNDDDTVFQFHPSNSSANPAISLKKYAGQPQDGRWALRLK